MFATSGIFHPSTIAASRQKSANACVVVKEEESLITLSWRASPTPEELTQSAELVNKLIEKHTLSYLSHDIRNINLKDFEMQKCLIKTFCRMFMHSSLIKVVHITKYAAPELIVMDHITTFVKRNIGNTQKIEFETCTTEAGALVWLQSVNPKVTAKTPGSRHSVAKTPPAFTFANFTSVTTEALPVGLTLKSHKDRVSVAIRHLFKQESPLYTDI